MKLAPLVAVSLSIFLVACSNESNVNAQESMQSITLEEIGKEWKLVSIDNNSTDITSTLNIDNQAQAKGNLACNNFFGTIELQENKFRIAKMGSTRRMCEPEVNDVEMTVSSTLASWSEVQLTEQMLTIKDDQHTLIYSIK